MTETCSEILPNRNYCILFDVCCVLTVHNILNEFDNTQRDGLSQIYSRNYQYQCTKDQMSLGPFIEEIREIRYTFKKNGS